MGIHADDGIDRFSQSGHADYLYPTTMNWPRWNHRGRTVMSHARTSQADKLLVKPFWRLVVQDDV